MIEEAIAALMRRGGYPQASAKAPRSMPSWESYDEADSRAEEKYAKASKKTPAGEAEAEARAYIRRLRQANYTTFSEDRAQVVVGYDDLVKDAVATLGPEKAGPTMLAALKKLTEAGFLAKAEPAGMALLLHRGVRAITNEKMSVMAETAPVGQG